MRESQELGWTEGWGPLITCRTSRGRKERLEDKELSRKCTMKKTGIICLK